MPQPPNRADMIILVRTAHDHGVTLFDAAEAYGPLEVERILGEALAPIRDQVVLSSKFGWNIDPDTGKSLGGLNSRPEHIRLAVDGMLEALPDGSHRPPLSTPRRPTGSHRGRGGHRQGFDCARKGPPFRPFGTADSSSRSHAVQPLTAVQNEYSIMARDPEAQILPICKELGIGFVCWSPLAMAFLTGAIDPNTQLQRGDFRAMVPWFAPENRPGNLTIVAVVKEDWAQPARMLLPLKLRWHG